MASIRQPLGPFFDDDGNLLVGGVVEFLDPNTTTPKVAYADEGLTIPADNPITIGSDGRLPYQVFYGSGDYLVRLYELIDPDIVSPSFPSDYAFFKQWIDQDVASAIGTNQLPDTYRLVDTIQDLTDLVSPNVYTTCEVIGYYTKDDQIDNRTYYWDSLSVATPDGGSVLSSSLVGTGRWILKTQSPVVDVRWFGMISNSGIEGNSALTACSAFANSNKDSSKEVFIPSGFYEMTGGNISIASDFVVSKDVFFRNANAQELLIEVNGKFDIKCEQAVNSFGSVGGVIFDFRSNTVAKSNFDLINPVWYDDTYLAVIYAGGNPYLINTAITIDLLANQSIYPVFRDGGSLDVTGDFLLTFNDISIQDKDAQIFKWVATQTSAKVVLSGLKVYSSNFFDDTQLNFTDTSGARLGLNNIFPVNDVFTMSISSLASLVAEGGYFDVASSSSISLPRAVIGLCVRSEGTITIVDDKFDINNFIIDNVATLQSFVNSVLSVNEVIDFKYMDVVYNVDFGVFTGKTIRNAIFNGTVELDGFFNLFDCVLNNTVTANGSTMVLKDCNLNSNVATPIFEAYDSSISGNVTASKMIVKSCIVSGELLPIALVGENWNFEIKDNEFRGGYIRPSGSELSDKAYIIGNHFEFPVAENPSTFLYVPIDDTNFSVTGEAITFNGNACTTAYNILVSENTPFVSDDEILSLSNGTLVRQTSFSRFSDGNDPNLQINQAGGTGVNTFILLPYASDLLVYDSLIITARNNNNANDGAYISPEDVYREVVPASNSYSIDIKKTNSANLLGYSYSFNLYPQKAR